MKKEWNMIRNLVKVEARGSVAVITCLSSYELRLLGTSCHTDCELYKVASSIMLSLEKGKKGVVVLSVCTPDKKHYDRDIFEVSWVGENKDKIFVNLMNPLSGQHPDGSSVSENGLEVSYEGVNYRIPWIFWGDTEISVNPQKVIEYANSFSGVRHNLFRDGNAFCRYLVGDADISEIEAAHMEYKMEEPGFLKQIAREVVQRRKEEITLNGAIKLLREEVKKNTAEIKSTTELLVSIRQILNGVFTWKDFLFGKRMNTWWNKLNQIRYRLEFMNRK